jgi:hypothetical protein
MWETLFFFLFFSWLGGDSLSTSTSYDGGPLLFRTTGKSGFSRHLGLCVDLGHVGDQVTDTGRVPPVGGNVSRVWLVRVWKRYR